MSRTDGGTKALARNAIHGVGRPRIWLTLALAGLLLPGRPAHAAKAGRGAPPKRRGAALAPQRPSGTVPRRDAAPTVPPDALLAERLERGETITIVALGDSLSTGFEMEHPERDAYPALFRSILQRRYPRAHIRMVVVGIPGETSAGGSNRVEHDVSAYQPDLVTVQYGGNDHGQGRTAEEYRRSLLDIIAKIRGGGDARILLATPPIISPTADTPMVNMAKAVARAEKLPLADMDAEIRARGTGPRGPFPLGRHPGIHLHAAMAGALYQAFLTLLGQPERLHTAIDVGTREVPQGAPLPVSVRVWGAGAGPVAVCLEHDGTRLTQKVTPGPTGGAVATFLLPPGPPSVSTNQQRLLAWARRGEAWSYDLRWLSVASVLTVGAGADIARTVLPANPLYPIAADDLSGSFRVTQDHDTLCFAVDVRDDWIHRQGDIPAPWDSDCVEVYLDLRPARIQGRPYWEEGVVGIFVYPGTGRWPTASWSALEPLPDAWNAVTVTSAAAPGGYQVELRVPLALLRALLSPGQNTIGLDIVLDDSDDRRGRKHQIVWAGSADDYLDPHLLGALALAPPAEAAPRVRVAVW